MLLDGVPIRTLNVKWLRQQIGVVSQEPVLFNTTIRENVLMGIPDNFSELTAVSDENERKSHLDKMVEAALKNANAWDFVVALPNGVNSNVGESGGMLSGGQKVSYKR